MRVTARLRNCASPCNRSTRSSLHRSAVSSMPTHLRTVSAPDQNTHCDMMLIRQKRAAPSSCLSPRARRAAVEARTPHARGEVIARAGKCHRTTAPARLTRAPVLMRCVTSWRRESVCCVRKTARVSAHFRHAVLPLVSPLQDRG